MPYYVKIRTKTHKKEEELFVLKDFVKEPS